MMYDLIIIGAGPAGISAGIYASRQRLKILILSKDIGGQVAKKAVDIENYPGFEKISGPELVELYKKQIKANELAVLVNEEVVAVEKPLGRSQSGEAENFLVKTKSGKEFEAVSVIVTSGAKSKLINVPGEEEFSGRGVSYCSLCDGPVFKNKTVTVVGGGNNGFESALFLSNYVKHITILEYNEKVNADAENQELVAKNLNIEIITNAQVARIEGKVFVNAIYYKDRISGEEKKLDVSGVFVEIGYSPATNFLGDLVELNDKKEIVFNSETLETKTPGLFSAGDCNVSKYKQIVMASGQGALAALSAYNYIRKVS
ncbi:MAG: pyridine nucleotide-disulfide oxidoreductase [Candidatus Staskawiczbacteria bacterium]|nr:pyridine nucleotide-disulfide oxidoreductase [Candidatus Staskawiczbacteria bacterium]